MKKLKKLSVLALFALSFALVLGGCSNGSSSSADSSDGGNGDGQTNNGGDTNGDGNNSSTDVNTGVQTDGSLILAARTIATQPKFVTGEKTVTLVDNPNGKNFQGGISLFDGTDYVPTKGDTLILTLKIKSSDSITYKDYNGLNVVLVDNSSGWTQICGDTSVVNGTGGTFPTDYTEVTIPLTITTTASSVDKVQFVFYEKASSDEITISLKDINAVASSGIVVHESADTGSYNFNLFNGFTESFDASQYSKVTLKMQITKDGKAIDTTTLDAQAGYKISINNSNSEDFNYGWSDGFAVVYVNNLSLDSNGYVTKEIDIKGKNGIAKANCFSAVGKKNFTLSVKEAKFEK